ncbi:MAG: tellurium resistance protein TerC [Comamonas sp.]
MKTLLSDWALTLPASIRITGAILVVLFVVFLVWFLLPGVLHWFRLRAIQNRIQRFVTKDYIVEFKHVFEKDKRLAALWKEYQDSLHRQYEVRDGQRVLKAVRATVSAEMFFNPQSVVDRRLGTEFFKHLPGIFTGIGIIGTFLGIIPGLQEFSDKFPKTPVDTSSQVADVAEQTKATEQTKDLFDGLQPLMVAVWHAFVVSAAAIIMAMVVTFIEKLLVAALYKRTEQIALAIDTHFQTGAGEEYMARLVQASEDSASQSKILKDALVKELGGLLRELTDRQIEAGKNQQAALGQVITQGIQQSLKEPLENIASTVKLASGDQSATTARLLQDVMASFSQRLNDLFAGQITGINELNQQTSKAMQEAVGTLQALVANIEASGQRSADAMAQRMAEAVEKLESRQAAMAAQSAAFVDQMRQLLASSQSETNQKLQASLEAMGTQVTGLLANLSETQRQTFEAGHQREQAMMDRTGVAVGAMSEAVDAVVKELGAATKQMTQSVDRLSQTTGKSVDQMLTGAELLANASRDFAAAGDRVTGVMSQVANVSSKLSETSGALISGSATLQQLLGDYRSQRDAVQQLVNELRTTVEAARKEASLTGDVLARIEASAARLADAQRQADAYLDGVSQVLGEAHTAFATEVTRTLDRANTEFHAKLASAVQMLSATVGELETTLTTMGSLIPTER